MDEATVIAVLTQGGAVGISLGLIWLVYKLWGHNNSTQREALEVIRKNTEVLTELKDAVSASRHAEERLAELITTRLLNRAGQVRFKEG